MGAAILFFGLQVLAPVVGTLLAYGHCYQQRLKGISGQKLEGMLIQWGFLASACLSILFFWCWPEGSLSWSNMPGFAWICKMTLIEPPQLDTSYPLAKAGVSLGLGFFCGLLARMNSFALTRRLVREVPRYYRAEEPVGKR